MPDNPKIHSVSPQQNYSFEGFIFNVDTGEYSSISIKFLFDWINEIEKYTKTVIDSINRAVLIKFLNVTHTIK